MDTKKKELIFTWEFYDEIKTTAKEDDRRESAQIRFLIKKGLKMRNYEINKNEKIE